MNNCNILYNNKKYFSTVSLTVRIWKRASLLVPSFLGGTVFDGKRSGRAVNTAVACSTGLTEKAQ